MVDWHVKHRPQKVDDLAGNASVVKTLRSWEASGNVPKCVMLTGSKGCGKTTTARILKNILNCSDVDFHESNSGDERGLPAARDIMKVCRYAPIGGGAAIWFMDEAHSLMKLAQEALLKVLEEPPRRSWFILATTDPEKLEDTFKDRASFLNMSPPTPTEIARDVVWKVTQLEGTPFTKDLCKAVGEACGCSVRKALIMAQQLATLPETERMVALKGMAVADENPAEHLCSLLLEHGRQPFKTLRYAATKASDNPESVRRSLLAYMGKVAVWSETEVALRVLDIAGRFFAPVYETGWAGLLGILMTLSKEKENAG